MHVARSPRDPLKPPGSTVSEAICNEWARTTRLWGGPCTRGGGRGTARRQFGRWGRGQGVRGIRQQSRMEAALCKAG